ncbi:MAG: aspartate kinase [Luteibaculum sp.]
MKVLKFGGTSVGSAERMRQVSDILLGVKGKKLVVLSAMSGTTNKLVELCGYLSKGNKLAAQELLLALDQEYQQKIKDLYKQESFIKQAKESFGRHFSFLKESALGEYSSHLEKSILAQGELISTELFILHLHERQIKAKLIPALNFMRINEEGEPDAKYIAEEIKPFLETDGEDIIITQGYICRNAFGEVDNLKRGGSDYTASLVGAAVLAEEIQIWTDIDGMHNNDPRIVKPTKPIARLSYDEAAELAYFGAKILHPSSILPARFNNIPVLLKNTMEPSAPGTTISADSEKGKIKAVAAKDEITAITIRSGRMLMAYGFLRAIFEVFERYKTPIDLITTSEVAVSVTIDNTAHLESIVKDLRLYGVVEVEDDMTIVSIVGNSIGDEKGVAFEVTKALTEVPIRMISFGGSKHNVSLLVPSAYKAATLVAFNKELFKLG